MNKKVLKGMVKNYFSNNNRMLGIFAFTFILMILLIVLTNDQENKLTLAQKYLNKEFTEERPQDWQAGSRTHRSKY